jgi:hypothetical protein
MLEEERNQAWKEGGMILWIWKYQSETRNWRTKRRNLARERNTPPGKE